MNKLRLRFKKTGRAKYISHLDLMRTFQRAFSRAQVPIKFSEGFNPHPRISIVAPLSLGVESVCELLDFEAACEIDAEVIERLNKAFPSGIEILSCAEPESKPGQLAWIEHEISFQYDNGVEQDAAEKIKALFGGEVIISKRTKRGQTDVDISPFIKDLETDVCGDVLVLKAKLAFGETVLGPAYITAAVEKYLPQLAPDEVRYLRTETLMKNFEKFR